jgi:dephospho-CoA kinase
MIVIGVVGGIASGKSLVCEQMRRLGAVVLDADQLGHEVLREPDVIAAVRERWGDRVLDEHGQIDRRAVATIVFAPPPSGPPELDFLEKLTHPRIGQKLTTRLAELRAAGNVRVAVLDAALLFEAGWDRQCDRMVYVEAAESIRRSRARQRGWTDAMFAARQAAQAGLLDKRARADWIIDNSTTLEHTDEQVRTLWKSLRML